MGSKGVLSSAAAGGSLIAASIVLVVGVAGLIGFRGFDSANAVAEKQSVVIDRASDAREAGANSKPAAAVIGSASKPDRGARASRRTAKRKSARRARRAKATERSGLSAPARPRTAQAPVAGAPADAQAPEASATDAAPEKDAPAAAVPPTPADDVVEDVTGVVDGVTKKPVESVGDVLLDVRDLLP